MSNLLSGDGGYQDLLGFNASSIRLEVEDLEVNDSLILDYATPNKNLVVDADKKVITEDKDTITGTTNQVIVNQVERAFTLSTPQDIATTSDVTFNSLTATNSITVGGDSTNASNGGLFLDVNSTQKYGIYKYNVNNIGMMLKDDNTFQFGSSSNRDPFFVKGDDVSNNIGQVGANWRFWDIMYSNNYISKYNSSATEGFFFNNSKHVGIFALSYWWLGVKVANGIRCYFGNSNFRPSSNLSYDLGSSTNRFNYLYTQNINLLGEIDFNGNIITSTIAGHLVSINQDLGTTDAVSFSTVNTGQGDNELYAMNQNVRTTDAVSFATVNTGQGDNELYSMNQNVRTTDDVSFNNITAVDITTTDLKVNNSFNTLDDFKIYQAGSSPIITQTQYNSSNGGSISTTTNTNDTFTSNNLSNISGAIGNTDIILTNTSASCFTATNEFKISTWNSGVLYLGFIKNTQLPSNSLSTNPQVLLRIGNSVDTLTYIPTSGTPNTTALATTSTIGTIDYKYTFNIDNSKNLTIDKYTPAIPGTTSYETFTTGTPVSASPEGRLCDVSVSSNVYTIKLTGGSSAVSSQRYGMRSKDGFRPTDYNSMDFIFNIKRFYGNNIYVGFCKKTLDLTTNVQINNLPNSNSQFKVMSISQNPDQYRDYNNPTGVNITFVSNINITPSSSNVDFTTIPAYRFIVSNNGDFTIQYRSSLTNPWQNTNVGTRNIDPNTEWCALIWDNDPSLSNLNVECIGTLTTATIPASTATIFNSSSTPTTPFTLEDNTYRVIASDNIASATDYKVVIDGSITNPGSLETKIEIDYLTPNKNLVLDASGILQSEDKISFVDVPNQITWSQNGQQFTASLPQNIGIDNSVNFKRLIVQDGNEGNPALRNANNSGLYFDGDLMYISIAGNSKIRFTDSLIRPETDLGVSLGRNIQAFLNTYTNNLFVKSKNNNGILYIDSNKEVQDVVLGTDEILVGRNGLPPVAQNKNTFYELHQNQFGSKIDPLKTATSIQIRGDGNGVYRTGTGRARALCINGFISPLSDDLNNAGKDYRRRFGFNIVKMTGSNVCVGFCLESTFTNNPTDAQVINSGSWAIRSGDGKVYEDGSLITTLGTFVEGDIIEYEIFQNIPSPYQTRYHIYKNGNVIYTSTVSIAGGTYYPQIFDGDSTDSTLQVNLVQSYKGGLVEATNLNWTNRSYLSLSIGGKPTTVETSNATATSPLIDQSGNAPTSIKTSNFTIVSANSWKYKYTLETTKRFLLNYNLGITTEGTGYGGTPYSNGDDLYLVVIKTDGTIGTSIQTNLNYHQSKKSNFNGTVIVELDKDEYIDFYFYKYSGFVLGGAGYRIACFNYSLTEL